MTAAEPANLGHVGAQDAVGGGSAGARAPSPRRTAACPGERFEPATPMRSWARSTPNSRPVPDTNHHDTADDARGDPSADDAETAGGPPVAAVGPGPTVGDLGVDGEPPARPLRRSSTLSMGSQATLEDRQVTDADLRTAMQVWRSSFAVSAGDRVVIVAADGHEAPAAAMMRAALRLGARPEPFLANAARLTSAPFLSRVRVALESTNASVVIAGSMTEAAIQSLEPARDEDRRHGLMLNADQDSLRPSLRADLVEMANLGNRVQRRIQAASTLRITSAVGTELTIKLSHKHRWHHDDGVVRPGETAVLPAGRLFTTPLSAEGVLVPDGGIAFGARFEPGMPRFRVKLEGGRATEAQGMPLSLLRELDGLWDEHEHGRRVGQIGLGTNTTVLIPVGVLGQDLVMPGVHLVLGHTSHRRTTAGWDGPTPIHLLMRRADVFVDGEALMVRGRYARALTTNGPGRPNDTGS